MTPSSASRGERWGWVRASTYTVTLGAALATALVLAPAAQAQSSISGAVSGVVTDIAGEPLDGVSVTLLRADETWERAFSATREGRFRDAFVPPGEYHLLVERFGFVPVRVTGVTLRSGIQAVVSVRLREAPPPVTETDRYTFGEVGTERSLGTGAKGLARRDLLQTPFQGHELSDVMSRWSLSGSGQAALGLPGRFTGVTLDGLRQQPASHPRVGPGFLHLTSISPFFLEEVEMAPQSIDTEQGGMSGPTLRATTVRGGNAFRMDAFGHALGVPLGFSDALGGSIDPRFGPEGGVLVRGPVVPDEVHFALGVQGRQAARPLSPLAASSQSGRRDFLEVIGDMERPESSRLGPPRISTWNVFSTFGRLDWRFGQSTTLTLRSNVSVVQDGGDAEAPVAPLQPPGAQDASDATVSATLFSRLGLQSAVEVRLGLESGSRDYLGAGGSEPGSAERVWIQQGGIIAGSALGVPGRYEQSAFRFKPLVHLSTDSHQIKLGIDGALHRYREESMETPVRSVGYPDLLAFQDGRGLVIRRDGTGRDVEVESSSLAFFAQDRWSVSEDVLLMVGLRAERESLPLSEILPNEAWREQTGIDRTPVEGSRTRISPRLTLQWTPGGAVGWAVEASGGIYYDQVHPGLLAEILSESGQTRIHRVLGTIPGVTGSDMAHEAASLSLLGPRFDAPRTQAVDVGLSRHLTPGTSLELSAGHRRTDFLPRRRDLNRLPARFAMDQFGRELFGVVVQEAGVIAIQPGSDRRFSDFDVVSALESDGWSTWSGVTVGLSHRSEDRLSLNAAYTFSEARDNGSQSLAGWPEMIAGRPAVGGTDPSWVEGRSNLDTPHRVVASGDLVLLRDPLIRVGGLYGFRSGTPFTPTVRDLLHGSDPTNPLGGAPITIPQGTEGLAEVTGRRPCLNALRGASPQRNVCRTDPVHDLNLRVGVGLATGAGWSLRLNVDGLNLLDSGPVVPDAALFVVDGAGELQAEPGGGLRLPVRVNPDFGEPLLHLTPGRAVRVGLAVRY
jgi:hypothetical protein